MKAFSFAFLMIVLSLSWKDIGRIYGKQENAVNKMVTI